MLNAELNSSFSIHHSAFHQCSRRGSNPHLRLEGAAAWPVSKTGAIFPFSTNGWIRTTTAAINNRGLYRLSYAGNVINERQSPRRRGGACQPAGRRATESATPCLVVARAIQSSA